MGATIMIDRTSPPVHAPAILDLARQLEADGLDPYDNSQRMMIELHQAGITDTCADDIIRQLDGLADYDSLADGNARRAAGPQYTDAELTAGLDPDAPGQPDRPPDPCDQLPLEWGRQLVEAVQQRITGRGQPGQRDPSPPRSTEYCTTRSAAEARRERRGVAMARRVIAAWPELRPALLALLLPDLAEELVLRLADDAVMAADLMRLLRKAEAA